MRDRIFIGNNVFDTLVAITEQEHRQGLMYKKWPPPNMCFPYKDSQVRKFWMFNTVSPLDIIFCNKNKIISIFGGEPLSTKLLGPEDPSNLIIEFPQGTVAKYGINIGDFAELKISIKTLAKMIDNNIQIFS